MTIFQNNWFVGICTGIISGILVFFLTKWIMDRKSKSEYYKQIDNANQSVINPLKPYITDQGLPRRDIFAALISSVSRSFSVDEKDMYSIESYCEELIREIMSDIYVSNDKKQEYSLMLAEYKNKLKLEPGAKQKDTDIIMEMKEERYSRKIRTFASVYLSIVTALFSTITSVFSFLGENPLMWIPIVTIMMTMFATVLIFWEKRIANKKKN